MSSMTHVWHDILDSRLTQSVSLDTLICTARHTKSGVTKRRRTKNLVDVFGKNDKCTECQKRIRLFQRYIVLKLNWIRFADQLISGLEVDGDAELVDTDSIRQERLQVSRQMKKSKWRHRNELIFSVYDREMSRSNRERSDDWEFLLEDSRGTLADLHVPSKKIRNVVHDSSDRDFDQKER